MFLSPSICERWQKKDFLSIPANLALQDFLREKKKMDRTKIMKSEELNRETVLLVMKRTSQHHHNFNSSCEILKLAINITNKLNQEKLTWLGVGGGDEAERHQLMVAKEFMDPIEHRRDKVIEIQDTLLHEHHRTSYLDHLLRRLLLFISVFLF